MHFEGLLKFIITATPRPRPIPPLSCYMYRMDRTKLHRRVFCSWTVFHIVRPTCSTACASPELFCDSRHFALLEWRLGRFGSAVQTFCLKACP